ncbi:MAG TPA: cytochrome c-type biogenesis protein [Burkholderiaceae bacterium]
MGKLLSALVFAGLAAWASISLADEAKPIGDDPVLEKHVQTLTEQLRCLVCQNMTIADSHAPLAIDLKNQVREKLARGMSDQEVVDYMVARYGDFVLYRPPVKSTTWLLWFGPFLLMLGGFAFLFWKLKSRDKQDDSASAADLQRAGEMLVTPPDTKE